MKDSNTCDFEVCIPWQLIYHQEYSFVLSQKLSTANGIDNAAAIWGRWIRRRAAIVVRRCDDVLVVGTTFDKNFS